MWHLFETEVTTPLSTYSNIVNRNTTKSSIQSKLGADFDDDEELDEIERYMTEKPASKEMNVLSWWKVRELEVILSKGSCILIIYIILIFRHTKPNFLDLPTWPRTILLFQQHQYHLNKFFPLLRI